MNIIDLFSGCGGLLDGFLQSGHYSHIASVEWDKAPMDTLRNRLETKWKCSEPENRVIYFDIQRLSELLNGFKDKKYGQHKGLISLVGNEPIDGIIGGPPCQAYSMAGRVRDTNNMKDDYRNYLFEYYLKIVDYFKPKFFIFENVQGILSASPNGTPITELLTRDIKNIGYEIISDIRKYALIDLSLYGIPQKRKRIILFGLNKEYFKDINIQTALKQFYENILPKYQLPIKTVYETIGDLPPCYPVETPFYQNNRNNSHTIPHTNISWHFARFQNKRDIELFRMLAKDIETQEYKYTDAKTLTQLYNDLVGANTKIHKHHVLRKDLPSTTISAHLHKDGSRFIHYDSQQARTITVREAARLQSFPDDFNFSGSMSSAYKMIGNAVPPLFAKVLGNAIFDFIKTYTKKSPLY